MPSASVDLPRDCILSLPEEPLDQICEEVRLLKPDRLVIFSTLCSWSVTCRAFARSGQRALYRAPFSLRPAFDPFVTAPKFRQALESNATLGKFVRTLDLRFFAEFVHVNVRARYYDFKAGRGYLHEGCLPAFDAFSWQQRIVKLCPNARSDSADFVSSSAAYRAVALALNLGATVPTGVAAFLPLDPSHLTSLSISTTNPYSAPSTGELDRLFSCLTAARLSSLLSFSFRENGSSAAIAFPPSAFSSFPSLCTLTLRDGRDMTLDKLDLLVQTSSSLEHIDLGRTKWSFPQSDSPSASLDTLARRSLARLPRLHTAILGHYPDPAGAPTAGKKEGKGVEVVWQREGDVDLEGEWDRKVGGEDSAWELGDEDDEDEEEGGDGEDKEEE